MQKFGLARYVTEENIAINGTLGGTKDIYDFVVNTFHIIQIELMEIWSEWER